MADPWPALGADGDGVVVGTWVVVTVGGVGGTVGLPPPPALPEPPHPASTQHPSTQTIVHIARVRGLKPASSLGPDADVLPAISTPQRRSRRAAFRLFLANALWFPE